jgi:hypothetical protein
MRYLKKNTYLDFSDRFFVFSRKWPPISFLVTVFTLFFRKWSPALSYVAIFTFQVKRTK